jgi:hypothetical protein
MIGHRSTAGLALLWALAFCAFAAQSASAQIGTKAVNTTAVTCVNVGDEDGEFADAHCSEKVPFGDGNFEHIAIENSKTTEVEVSQEGTSKLNGTLAGVSTEVTCKKVKSVAGKSFLHNVETEGKHTATGEFQVNFTECTVVKPSKCVVAEPIVVTASAVGVEGLNKKEEMGVEFKGSGAEGTFAELKFANKGAESCALNGKSFLIKGSVISTGKVAQGNKHIGATAVYEDANEMETLEIGVKKASFAAVFTTRMSGVGGEPISGTTVT